MPSSPPTFDPAGHAHVWSEPPSFHDQMAEQLRRAPWLGLSILLHALVLLVLLALPRGKRPIHEVAEVAMLPQPLVEEIPEEPEEQVEPPLEPKEVQPELSETLSEVDTTDPVPSELEPTEFPDDNDFEDSAFNPIGLGPGKDGGGGKYGNRRGGPGGRPRRPNPLIDTSLRWLRDHQDADGKWDSDGFMKHDPPHDLCTGPGNPVHDVGLTGLALLCFLAEGSTLREGEYRDTVRRATRWLKDQCADDGQLGEWSGSSAMYSQAIATLALVEAYGLSDYKVLRPYAQKAIDYCQRARNPYGAWRYHPRDGDNDSSVTGWMVLALNSARDFGLRVDESAFRYAMAWFDEVTDPSTGQVGYTKRGEGSSREDHLKQRFPADKTESLTAVGLLSRIFMGQKPEDEPVLRQAADTMLKRPPVWDEGAGTIDLYYWYYGSYAMFQMGHRHWSAWRKALERSLVASQCKKGAAEGSWDPVGVWGEQGGRVYSTALGTLCCQTYYRYTRLIH